MHLHNDAISELASTLFHYDLYACSQLLRRLLRSDLPTTTQVLERARDAAASVSPQAERAIKNIEKELKHSSTDAASSRPVSVLYGQAIASGGQLTFQTSLAARQIQPRAPYTAAPASRVPDSSSSAQAARAQAPTPAAPHRAATRSEDQATPLEQPGHTAGLQSPQPDASFIHHTIANAGSSTPLSEAKPPQSTAAEAAQSSSGTHDAPPPISVAKRKFRERKVPESRIGRAAGFAGLGVSLAWGAATDAVSQALGPASDKPRGMLSEANAKRLANALCRMRGAALKIGQMMSIQDEDVLPPAVAAALEQARPCSWPRRRHALCCAVLWHHILFLARAPGQLPGRGSSMAAICP